MTLITGIIADSAGVPAKGLIEFAQVSRIDTGSALVTGTVATAQVVDGVLRAADGSGFDMPANPAGTAVRVLERLGGRTFEWWTQIPAAGPVEYRSLVPVEPIGQPLYGPPPWLEDVLQARDETIDIVESVGGLTGINQAVSDAQAAKTAAANSASAAQTSKTGADSAKTAAELARDQAQAVGNTNDTIIAGRVNDSASATRAAMDPVMQGRIATTIVSVNVRDFGAVPLSQNGGAGANAGVQAAIDYVATKGGGEVVVDADYWIKAHVPDPDGGNSLLDVGGVAMKDGVHLRFTANGIFRVIPNSEWKYQCIRVFNKTNVRISGPGRIIGERGSHGTNPIKAGEWGYGVSVQGGSNITIEDVTVTDMWGDGIDVTFVNPDSLGRRPPKNVIVRNVVCDGNRRQGMSLEAGDWVLIEDSKFINTGGTTGTLPMNGLDIEPSNDTTQCSNIMVRRCRFENNGKTGTVDGGFGCSVYMLGTTNVTVDNCDFVSNKGAHQFINLLSGPNVRLINSRFSGTATQCVQIVGGVGRVIADNVFDNKVRIAPNTVSNIATNVSIARNRWSVNAPAKIDGLVEVNEHATHTEIIDNFFEHKGVRGSGVWVRVASSVAPLTLQNVRIRGNTFINMTNAVTTAAVTNMRIEDNRIDASSDAAINLPVALVGVSIRGNRISGSNLVTSLAAIVLAGGSDGCMFDGNKFEIEPVTSVVETRRGTHAFRLTFGPTTNTIIRNTHITGALSYYLDMGTKTGSYFESTPGTWV